MSSKSLAHFVEAIPLVGKWWELLLRLPLNYRMVLEAAFAVNKRPNSVFSAVTKMLVDLCSAECVKFSECSRIHWSPKTYLLLHKSRHHLFCLDNTEFQICKVCEFWFCDLKPRRKRLPDTGRLFERILGRIMFFTWFSIATYSKVIGILILDALLYLYINKNSWILQWKQLCTYIVRLQEPKTSFLINS